MDYHEGDLNKIYPFVEMTSVEVQLYNKITNDIF